MNRRSCGFTAVELLIVIIVLGLAASVAIPPILRGRRIDRIERCARNLQVLWEAQESYRKVRGRPPEERGSAYWLALTKPPSPPLADGAEALVCPLAGETPRPGFTSYRGPAGDAAKLGKKEMLGADLPDNHGPGEGGHILSVEGSVRAHRGHDAAWRAALERTAP
jgi:prepilin-type N-terminal cleavage/methylation domain-containing protein